jgi:hypothetical protein
MSLVGYPFDLEERVEDAIVAHIKAVTGGIKMVVPWRTQAIAAYPLVVVQCEGSDNHSDVGEWTGRRRLQVVVSIVTEAVNNNGDPGTDEQFLTSREIHRRVKSEVVGALAGTKVHEELNTIDVQGVLFSQCHIVAQTADAGDGKLVTMQQLDVIAQPKEI